MEQVQASIVSLMRDGGASNEPAFALTDGSGKFTFKDVPVGRYTIRVERKNFVGPEINEAYTTGVVKNIAVEKDKTTSTEMFLPTA